MSKVIDLSKFGDEVDERDMNQLRVQAADPDCTSWTCPMCGRAVNYKPDRECAECGWEIPAGIVCAEPVASLRSEDAMTTMTLQEAIDVLKANRPPDHQAMFANVREAIDVVLDNLAYLEARVSLDLEAMNAKLVAQLERLGPRISQLKVRIAELEAKEGSPDAHPHE